MATGNATVTGQGGRSRCGIMWASREFWFIFSCIIGFLKSNCIFLSGSESGSEKISWIESLSIHNKHWSHSRKQGGCPARVEPGSPYSDTSAAVSRILSTGVMPAVRSFICLAETTKPHCKPQMRLSAEATNPKSLNGPFDFLFCVAPDWVYPAPSIALGAVSPYLTISPLPINSHSAWQAVFFLWHWPSLSLETKCPYFHTESCPVVSGLSSTAACRRDSERPPQK